MRKARNMAANHNSDLLYQINEKTNGSLIKVVEANRDMHRNQVLSNTERSRRNRFIAKNANMNNTNQPGQTSIRQNTRTENNASNNRKETSEIRRNVAKYPNRQTDRRNVKTPGKIYSYPGTEVKNFRNGRNSNYTSKSNVERIKVESIGNPKVTYGGIKDNPAENQRRRRRLEALIRERAQI